MSINPGIQEMKILGLLMMLMACDLAVKGQGLSESGGTGAAENSAYSGMADLSGYIRGTFYLGEKNDHPNLTSGYGEAALKFQLNPDTKVRLFTEIRLRGGFEYDKYIIHPQVREFYGDFYSGRFHFRIGQQIISWGRADGFNPTDNIIPRNYFVRSPEPDDMRLGNFLFQGRCRINDNLSLTAIWVPFYRNSIYRFDLFEMPGFVHFIKQDNWDWGYKDGNIAGKIEFLFTGIDGSLSWFNGYDPQPGIDMVNFSIIPPGNMSVDLKQSAYKLNNFGADFAAAPWGFGLRGEVGLRIPSQIYKDEIFTPERDLRFVIGIDRMIGDFSILAQYMGQWVLNYREMPELMIFRDFDPGFFMSPSLYQQLPRMIEEQMKGFNRLMYGQTNRYSNTVMVRPSVNLLYNTLEFELFAIYNINTEEFNFTTKVAYKIRDNLTLSLGGQYFTGPENSLYDMIGPVFNGGYLEIKYSFQAPSF